MPETMLVLRGRVLPMTGQWSDGPQVIECPLARAQSVT
jgi:hypothetical protein